MNRSETIGELAKALAAAQGKFEAVGKEKENPFFHSKYADLPAVVMAASPILSEHGLSVSQWPEYDPETQTDFLTTLLMHSSGEWMESTMRLFLVKQDPQGQGSAITYARRYAYSAVVGIVTDVDDDGNAASRGAQAGSRPTTRRAAPRRATVPDGQATAPGGNAQPQTGDEEMTEPWSVPDDDVATMRARELVEALRAAGLEDTGSVLQMRLRLQEHRSGVTSVKTEAAGDKSDPNLATEKQLSFVNSLFEGYERDERLSAISDLVERDITSSRELTKKEASKVIEIMKPEDK